MPLARASPMSAMAGPLSAMLRRLTAALASHPSPAPRRHVALLVTRSPTPPCLYKSLYDRPTPLFHPCITSSLERPRAAPHLAPSTSCPPRPTGALPPPPGLSLPPPSSPPPPFDERHHQSPSGQVAMPLSFLSSPSCSRTPPLPPTTIGAPLRR
jgi:hypothetical protein